PTRSKSLDGTVRGQSPRPGARVQRGTVVTIEVYDYRKPRSGGGGKGKGKDKGKGNGKGGGGGGD
ncbi:MAG TPA: PASTA domain-containing protein, partial [Actinomycetota bacterium]|nr:PASTA domain-containing protein [Actinomycetota bacterium]